jgi:hypothetical protein
MFIHIDGIFCAGICWPDCFVEDLRRVRYVSEDFRLGREGNVLLRDKLRVGGVRGTTWISSSSLLDGGLRRCRT